MAPIPLPNELVDLLALHSSLLTALSLHYAHNGTATPVDIRDLTQSVSLVWKKRKVVLDDIRLCIGVLSSGPSGNENPFYLSDYSGGKICLEIRDEHKMSGSLGTMNEDAIQAMFMQSLDHLWKTWSETQGTKPRITSRPIATPRRRGRPSKLEFAQKSIEPFINDASISKFLSQIPHAEIILCASAAAIAPLREKGRKRLREFRECVQHGQSQKKFRKTTGKENEPNPVQQQQQQQQQTQAKITDFTSVRKSNLLDRILAKEAAIAVGPTPPSPAELQRRAALQRSEEVLGILALLATSKGPGPRVSFSLAALIQSLQGSIRSPLSKDELMKCVDVLATEVTPGYISIVRMGAISSVVINQGMRPVDVKGRLAALCVA